MSINVKRIYDELSGEDGKRILIDRLWPRGVSKDEAQLDKWLKDIAPSHDLRKWFDHDPHKFAEFKKLYKEELENNDEQSMALAKLKKIIEKDDVTLLYGAKETKYNHVQVLLEYL